MHIIAILAPILGCIVMLFLVNRESKLRDSIYIPIVFIPLIIGLGILFFITYLDNQETLLEIETEKTELQGMGCKQLKQFLDDIITEKIEVYAESKDTAMQLLLTRCN